MGEVRRYMDDVMEKATRVEYVLLAMRLPRDTEQPPLVEKEEEAEKPDVMDYQITPWATTTSTPVPVHKVKPAKKVLTESDWSSFLNYMAAESGSRSREANPSK